VARKNEKSNSIKRPVDILEGQIGFALESLTVIYRLLK
jgi:hypothetical protein